MENQIFRDIKTKLDLNGPYLSYSSQPVSASCTSPGSVSYTGIATVSYGASVSSPNNVGIVTYQWYETGVGALSDTSAISGSATGTLTITSMTSGTDDNRTFWVEADYIPSVADYKTGNAPNEPLASDTVGVTIAPNIEIVAQPTSISVDPNTATTFTVNADLTSGGTTGLIYQWYLDGIAETDRTKTTTITSSTTVATNHSYSWNSDASHAVPATASNIKTTIAAAQGGKGGNDSGGNGGNGGSGKAGSFSLTASEVQGKTLEFYIASRGSDSGSGGNNAFGPGGTVTGEGDGSRGGVAGNRGWSGGGGGAGAASKVQINGSSGYIVVAGGGGGGGGGALQRDALGPSCDGPVNAGDWLTSGSPVPASNGYLTPESDHGGGDGSGGGGGGGGSPGHSAGNRGWDRNHGAYGGCGGGSKYDTSKASLISYWFNSGNGYASLDYDSTSTTETTTERKTIISGVNTPTLTLTSDWVGVQTAMCRVSHGTATNSPLDTDVVTLAVVSGAGGNIIKIEDIGITDTARLQTADLSGGEIIMDTVAGIANDAGQQNIFSFYSPNGDMDVEMDLYGGKGEDHTDSGNSGGEGGYARIRFTMAQDQEYVVAGLSTFINAPFLYRGANLMAVVGGGGDAGTDGRGGQGGGVNNMGESGRGIGAGDAQSVPVVGTNGKFGSVFVASAPYPGDVQGTGQEGGTTIKCTKGVYWRQQGKAECDSVGATKYYLGNGTQVTNTESITRGYKGGYNIIQTAGSRSATGGGDGGSGAAGGNAGTSGGGAGGSGWADTGTITIVDTQLGGSTTNAKVVLRVVT